MMGNIRNDNEVNTHRTSYFLRLRTLAASGIFWLLFFAAEKSNWLEGIQVKNHLDDTAKRAFALSK
jgi:hypothetical protein